MNLSYCNCESCESIAVPRDVRIHDAMFENIYILYCQFLCVSCFRHHSHRIDFETKELALAAKTLVMSFGFADGNKYPV